MLRNGVFKHPSPWDRCRYLLPHEFVPNWHDSPISTFTALESLNTHNTYKRLHQCCIDLTVMKCLAKSCLLPPPWHCLLELLPPSQHWSAKLHSALWPKPPTSAELHQVAMISSHLDRRQPHAGHHNNQVEANRASHFIPEQASCTGLGKNCRPICMLIKCLH